MNQAICIRFSMANLTRLAVIKAMSWCINSWMQSVCSCIWGTLKSFHQSDLCRRVEKSEKRILFKSFFDVEQIKSVQSKSC